MPDRRNDVGLEFQPKKLAELKCTRAAREELARIVTNAAKLSDEYQPDKMIEAPEATFNHTDREGNTRKVTVYQEIRKHPHGGADYIDYRVAIRPENGEPTEFVFSNQDYALRMISGGEHIDFDTNFDFDTNKGVEDLELGNAVYNIAESLKRAFKKYNAERGTTARMGREKAQIVLYGL